MSSRPPWLPQPANVSGADEEVIQRLYQEFLEQFENGKCRFRGMPVRWDRGTDYGLPCDRGFWHLISRENKRQGTRELDRLRLAHVGWCRAVIRNEQDETVLKWEARERGRLRTYLWLPDDDFVVVLEYRDTKASSFMQLVTAYPVSGESTRKKLRQRLQRGNQI